MREDGGGVAVIVGDVACKRMATVSLLSLGCEGGGGGLVVGDVA